MDSTCGFTGKLSGLNGLISSLLSGIGGSKAGVFLDTLATLTDAEQEIVLETFTKILERIKNGEERLLTLDESAKDEFYSTLHLEIISAFASKKTARLKLISGGKSSAF